MVVTSTPRVSKAVQRRFVGRVEALDVFYLRFAYRHMKNGVYYCGCGGLGKSWILQKIILDSQGDSTRFVADIVDFFDTRNHSVRGLQDTIRSHLQAPEAFRPYDEAAANLDAARLKGRETRPGTIASLEARANRVFINCCQQAIIGREVILLFDTFERVQQRHVGQWLLQEFLPQVRSLIVAIAGRPDPAPAQMPDNVVSYELEGLGLEEASEHIRRQLPKAPDGFVETVWRRSGGAPLIIDLILDLPEPLRGEYVAGLSNLGDDERIQDSPPSQRGLVRQFSRPGRHNRVIWAMAYLRRRFDVSMLKYVVKNLGEKWFKPGDYDAIFKELCRLTYIKEYPNQQSHLLHDEVQRMIAEYVLVEAADRGMQDSLYDLAVDHYYPETIEEAERVNDHDLARQLRAEQLGYILDREPDTGLEEYQIYRSGCIETEHDYDFEELLWGEVREQLDRFKDKGFQACNERGEWLRKHSLFQKAEEHYRQMTAQFKAQPIEVRQALGFALMRQGKIDDAVAVFEESRNMVEEDDFETIAMIENNLGQATEISGQWDSSLEHYARSFRAATMANNPARMASVYINRGYLYSLQGLYPNAKQQCEHAIELLKSLPGDQENIQRAIYAWMDLGTANRHSGDYATAAQHYHKSLELARENQNQEAISDALQNLGINEHLWGRILRREDKELFTACEHQLQAWRHLTEALEMAHRPDWRNAIASGLNRLAKVYREIGRLETVLSQMTETKDAAEKLQELQQTAITYQMPFEIEYEHDLLTIGHFAQMGWLEKAARLFEVSALIAGEVNNFHRTLESLTEMARLLEELGIEDRVPLVIRRIERIKGYDYQAALFGAMGEVILADLDFRRQNLDFALKRYKKTYADIAEQSGYAVHLLNDRLRDLNWRLRTLPADTALVWCDALEKEWQRRSALSKRPEMRDWLEQVRFEALKRQREVKDGS